MSGEVRKLYTLRRGRFARFEGGPEPRQYVPGERVALTAAELGRMPALFDPEPVAEEAPPPAPSHEFRTVVEPAAEPAAEPAEEPAKKAAEPAEEADKPAGGRSEAAPFYRSRKG